MTRFAVAVAALAAVLAWPRAARADEPPADAPKDVVVTAMPLLGDATVDPGSWMEVLVEIKSTAAEPRAGLVTAFGYSKWNGVRGNSDVAPFSVAPGATVQLRVPVRVGNDGDPVVRVTTADARLLFERNFTRANHNRTLLLDVGGGPALGAQLGGVPVGSRNDPWAYRPTPYGGWGYGTPYPSSSSGPTTIEVLHAARDALTGEPLLPSRAAGYARIAAVLIRSDALVGLHADELAALAGWTMAGGTLGVVVARPEDLRHATVAALCGGEAKHAAVPAEMLALIATGGGAGPGSPPLGSSSKVAPSDVPPPDELRPLLTGYSGGNLRGSSYGASASYGLGEVHLLGFDPSAKVTAAAGNLTIADSPWAQVRILDLLRRANERQTSVLFVLGEDQVVSGEVRQYLDPNESSRWGIVLASLLLCLYAVAAGPINFTTWRRRGAPLKALPTLAIAAALGFGGVVAIGVTAKGCSGRARHLTFIEAGAGMKSGAAWRWRGFFVPSARTMTVRAGHAASVLGVEREDYRDETSDQLMLDRDGLRLADLDVRPWQTMVVREDGFASLGGGVALVKDGTATTVVNRTGHALRALILWQPGDGTLLMPRLEAGASAKSATFARAHGYSTRPGALPANELEPEYLRSDVDAASENVTSAWLAVKAAVGGSSNWFPDDVPVLLAQIEGGEGETGDSGLRIDHDRVLVRIVGYGGAP